MTKWVLVPIGILLAIATYGIAYSALEWSDVLSTASALVVFFAALVLASKL